MAKRQFKSRRSKKIRVTVLKRDVPDFKMLARALVELAEDNCKMTIKIRILRMVMLAWYMIILGIEVSGRVKMSNELRITGLFKSKTGKIIGYTWQIEENKKTGKSKSSDIIEWIEQKGGRAYILSSNNRIYCSIRVLSNGERTIQSSQNGTWSNDLRDLAVTTK